MEMEEEYEWLKRKLMWLMPREWFTPLGR